jgi:hypothetical protein
MGSLRRLCASGHRALYSDPVAWASQPGHRLVPIDADGEQWLERRRCLGCGEVLQRLCLVKVRYLDEPDPEPGTEGAPLFVAQTVNLDELRRQAVRVAYQRAGSMQGAAELLGVSRRALGVWTLSDPDMVPGYIPKRGRPRRPHAASSGPPHAQGPRAAELGGAHG